MTQEEKAIRISEIDNEIAALDAEYKEWQDSRANVDGNNAEVFQQVGTNMLKEAKYYNKRRRLEDERRDLTPVSDAVNAYLESIKKPGKFEQSKLDVLQGKASIDNSLNPFGGKAI